MEQFMVLMCLFSSNQLILDQKNVQVKSKPIIYFKKYIKLFFNYVMEMSHVKIQRHP